MINFDLKHIIWNTNYISKTLPQIMDVRIAGINRSLDLRKKKKKRNDFTECIRKLSYVLLSFHIG